MVLHCMVRWTLVNRPCLVASKPDRYTTRNSPIRRSMDAHLVTLVAAVARMDLTLDTSDERQEKQEGPDGYSAVTIFSSPIGCQGLTYDDVILMPGECCSCPKYSFRSKMKIHINGDPCVSLMVAWWISNVDCAFVFVGISQIHVLQY